MQSWSTKKGEGRSTQQLSQERLSNEGEGVKEEERTKRLEAYFLPSLSPRLPQGEVSESLNTLGPKGTDLGIWSGILLQGLCMIYGADMSGPTHYI